MAKQWANRIVLCIQLVCWCSVSGLLLHRGISNLHRIHDTRADYGLSHNASCNCTDNSTVISNQKAQRQMHGQFAGIVMIVIAGIMFIISPSFLVIKLLEIRRRRQRIRRITEEDRPPRYEDVTESAPRYSALFNITETGEFALQENIQNENENNVNENTSSMNR